MNNLNFEVRDGKTVGFFPKLKDGKYSIREVKSIRSLDQNKMYWGYIVKRIALEYKEYGYLKTKSEIHDIFKKALLPRKRIYSDFSKKYILMSTSTTELNTKQFSEYIEQIKSLCEFGKLHKIPGFEEISPFVIEDIGEEELLSWIDKIIA